MRWILKIFAIIIACAILLAVFAPGTIVVTAIITAERIGIIWCVLNLFVNIVSGKDIVEIVNEKRNR